MEKEEIIIRDIYAFYGRVIYTAQIVEKGLMNIIVLQNLEDNISRTRYYELLFEKSSLTAGQLLREIERLRIFPKNEELLEEFHKKRDFIVHNYWWENDINFNDHGSIDRIKKELKSYYVFFEELIAIIVQYRINFEKKHSLVIDESLNEALFRTSLLEIKKFRKINKNEIVKDIYCCNDSLNNVIIIFTLADDTIWTLGEIGLTQYFNKINTSEIIAIEELIGIFPIAQFNPRPKNVKPWSYNLDLKKRGLKLVVFRENSNSINWKIDQQ